MAKKMKYELSTYQTMQGSLEPVLADEYLQPIEFVDMYVSQVRNKRDTSCILKFLSAMFPLEKYPFLKRVRSQSGGNLQVIVCDTESKTLDRVLSVISPYSDSLGPLVPVKVPATAPLTRQQFQDSLQHWPVNFHEDKLITKLLSGTYFDKTQLEVHHTHMTEAIRLAERAAKLGQLPIGAVIVDPTVNKVVAKSHDCRQGNHFLQHTTMVCIDMVAKSQGGGMWTYDEDTDLYATDQDTTPDDSSNTTKKSALPYLCTGYHLYITQEPCVMCAMALVHSRIECVYYGSSHSEGALGSKYKLHTQKGLNHHYRVFKGLMKEKCDQLYASS